MESKDKYMDALKRITIAYYHSDDSKNTKDRFKEDLILFRGLIDKCFEEKECQEQVQNRETNFEHYEQKIRDSYFNFALVNGDVKFCSECSCGECSFYNDDHSCLGKKIHWALAQYKPKYKLTQIEYDLLRTNNMSHDRKLSSFATYENLREVGYFKDIDFDLTINDILANCEVIK